MITQNANLNTASKPFSVHTFFSVQGGSSMVSLVASVGPTYGISNLRTGGNVTGLTIATIVGARPQFIKAAALSRAIAVRNAASGMVLIRERLVHTGQHYDTAMSQVFFDELGLPKPDAYLGVGSGPHGMQTGRMLERVEACLLEDRPDAVLVYGDTNSTLAGALAATKLHLPLIHVEAGLRSGRRAMPEEINRILTDHVADLLFCPTERALGNLRAEGIVNGVHMVGDIMLDSLRHALDTVTDWQASLNKYGLAPNSYLLATLHRAENTDDPIRLREILGALEQVANATPVVLALHPRTRARLEEYNLPVPNTLNVVPPASYLALLSLMRQSLGVLTDSGGMQKEAYCLGRPCLTLREETEWTETVEIGANTLAGADGNRILEWHARLRSGTLHFPLGTNIYGDGHAAEKMLAIIEERHAW